MNSDGFDLPKLRLDPAVLSTPTVPTKIRKRREQFIMVPMRWYEMLANPIPAGRCTCLVAMYVLYLHWKNQGKPFKLANGMLDYDGISRDSKTRALKELESRGLVTVEWRPKKAPIVRVLE
jgi:hypothetical protein